MTYPTLLSQAIPHDAPATETFEYWVAQAAAGRNQAECWQECHRIAEKALGNICGLQIKDLIEAIANDRRRSNSELIYEIVCATERVITPEEVFCVMLVTHGNTGLKDSSSVAASLSRLYKKGVIGRISKGKYIRKAKGGDEK